MTDVANPSAAGHAAIGAFKEIAEVFGDFIAPLLGLGLGVYLGAANVIGGPWTVAKAFASLPNWGPTNAQCSWIGGGIFALGYGMAAVGCWSMDGAEGSWKRGVTRTLAGIFGGLAIGSIIWASQNQMTQGFLDTAIEQIEKAA